MFVDIAFNCTSGSFPSRIPEIISTCKQKRVMPMMVGLDLESSHTAAVLAQKYNTFSFFGIHPLHIPGNIPQDGPTEGYLNDLKRMFEEELTRCAGSVLAVGECGLDYYRSQDKERQIPLFEMQIETARSFELPCFIHCRAAFDDVYRRINGISGVVHSFDGTIDEAKLFISKGMYIGLNGCSMRSEESINVVREIPLEKILLETDSPYCLIRKSYAASKYVQVIKARENRPEYLLNVAEAVAAIKGIRIEEVEERVLRNTLELFPRIKERIGSWEH